MPHYWIALRKGRDRRFARAITRIFSLPAPDRESARRAARRRWPGYQVLFVDPLPGVVGTGTVTSQDMIRPDGYDVDTDALAQRFFRKVVYDEAVEACQRLGEEHRDGLLQFEDLRSLVTVPSAAELVQALDDVYHDLSWHFAREEMLGGVYRSLAALGGYNNSLRRLHHDHLGILTALAGIIAQLTGATDQPEEACLQCARAATHMLLEQWQAHEYRERLLTESVLCC